MLMPSRADILVLVAYSRCVDHRLLFIYDLFGFRMPPDVLVLGPLYLIFLILDLDDG